MKRHCDHRNPYKGQYLIGPGLQVQRLTPLSSWWDTWRNTGRQGERERSESLHLYQQAAGREKYWAWLEYLKPQSQPAVTHFLQQDHFYSKKATPPNSATAPYKPMGVIVTETTTVS